VYVGGVLLLVIIDFGFFVGEWWWWNGEGCGCDGGGRATSVD